MKENFIESISKVRIIDNRNPHMEVYFSNKNKGVIADYLTIFHYKDGFCIVHKALENTVLSKKLEMALYILNHPKIKVKLCLLSITQNINPKFHGVFIEKDKLTNKKTH